MSIDQLDQLLQDAAPRTRLNVSASGARALIRDARREARHRPSRSTRAAVAAGLTVALVGGGTAAAFANEDIRDWFFSGVQDPYVTFQYTVPSGEVCTETSGDPIASDPAAADALRNWLASADLTSLIDVDAALSQVRAYDEYDTSLIGSDVEYQMAVGIAVVLAAREQLSTRGYEPGSIDQWKTQRDCTEPAP